MRLVRTGDLRILDFDTESRPLSYLGQDFTTADITAIAACWTDSRDVQVWAQTKDDRSRWSMLRGFAKLYGEADIITGHFCIRHDLPRLNAMMIEAELPPLGPKMVSDTFTHLVSLQGISKSQENLGEMFGVDAPKVGMSTPKWRKANRLLKSGVEHSIERVCGDVIQHIELRNALIARGLLRSPVLWRPR